EELNLCQRRSHCRVPSVDRWQIPDVETPGAGSSRWIRTISCTVMSRDGAPALAAITNLVSVAGVAPALPVRETSVLAAVRHGHDFEVANSIHGGNRTRIARWKDGSTDPLYDTDKAKHHGQGLASK